MGPVQGHYRDAPDWALYKGIVVLTKHDLCTKSIDRSAVSVEQASMLVYIAVSYLHNLNTTGMPK